jgi:quinol monooxygenase YgiN
MTKVALYVELKAKSEKAEELAQFLVTAQPLAAAEPETVAWFVIRFDETTFGIFDTFDDETGRQAHLNGRIAEALMSRADDLLAATPVIRQPTVLADKLPR